MDDGFHVDVDGRCDGQQPYGFVVVVMIAGALPCKDSPDSQSRLKPGSGPGRTSPNESLSVCVLRLSALVVCYLTASVFDFCCGRAQLTFAALGS